MIGACALVVWIVERARIRQSRLEPADFPGPGRRLRMIERRLKRVFAVQAMEHGDLFERYAVYRRPIDTRLVVSPNAAWLGLSEIGRSIVLRHLWHSIESIAENAIVIVDHPGQLWSRDIDEEFLSSSDGAKHAARSVSGRPFVPQLAEDY
jgi:hypothetical protein